MSNEFPWINTKTGAYQVEGGSWVGHAAFLIIHEDRTVSHIPKKQPADEFVTEQEAKDYIYLWAEGYARAHESELLILNPP